MMAFALFIVCLLIILGPRPRRPEPVSPEIRKVAEPLCSKLGRGWIREEDATAGLTIPAVRIFWAEQLGWIEYRERRFHQGMWLRLTPAGARAA